MSRRKTTERRSAAPPAAAANDKENTKPNAKAPQQSGEQDDALAASTKAARGVPSSGQSFPIHVLNVQLLDSKPLIWRRVCVPSSYTLGQLHCVIQRLFCWFDCHMHQFEVGERIFEPATALRDFDGLPDSEREEDVTLATIIPNRSDHVLYTYDMGDSYLHAVITEEVTTSSDPKHRHHHYPFCEAGSRCGPPEDCGGIYCYNDLVKEHNKRKRGVTRGLDEDLYNDEWLAWAKGALGFDFQPEYFSAADINERLQLPAHRG